MSDVAVQTSTPRRRPLVVGAVVLMTLGVAIGIGGFVLWQTHRTYHFAVVQPGVLYRDGFKSRPQLEATLDRVHPKMVVSLIDETELVDSHKLHLATEAELCLDHKVLLYRIPVELGGWPTSEDIRNFLAAVNDKQNQPVLVHCAQGVRRTGMFVAAYQESVLGYDRAKTKAAVLGFGHGKDTVEQIDRFIDRYDPKTQTVPTDLGKGNE